MAIAAMDGPGQEWAILDPESPQKPPQSPEANGMTQGHPFRIWKAARLRRLLDAADDTSSQTITPHPARLPRSLAQRARFLAQRADGLCSALSHLRSQLLHLPEARAGACATEFIECIRARASRKRFPARRRLKDPPGVSRPFHTPGAYISADQLLSDEAVCDWRWVLFHGGDALHLLRDSHPWHLTIGFLATLYGIDSFWVRGLIDLDRRPKRGPRPRSWRPRPRGPCCLCGQPTHCIPVLLHPGCRARRMANAP